MRSLLLGWVLLSAALAAAQAPVCFRSKYAMEPPVRIKSLRLTDGGLLSPKEKSSILRELRRQCICWPCVVGEEVGQQIRQMYQWHGYFQAVADVDIRQVGGDAYVIAARIQEGPQYRLKSIEFANGAAFPVVQLQELIGFVAGDIFDTRRLAEGLQRLRHLYATRGYLNFTVVPETVPDAGSGSIALRLDIDEGPVFHLGPLLVTGLDTVPALGHRLLETWQPHIGEIYDVDFVDNFLDKSLGLSGTRLPRVTYIQDANSRIVTLRVEFSLSD